VLCWDCKLSCSELFATLCVLHAGVTSGVTLSAAGPTAAAAGGTAAGGGVAPLSATVKVLGPTSLMKQVKDPSSSLSSGAGAGSMLASRAGTAVVSLQPVLIRPGVAMTAPASAQTNTIQASVIGAGRPSTVSSVSLQPVLQQTVHDIVQQAQAQATRQGFVSPTTSSFSQPTPPPASVIGSPAPSASPAGPGVQTAADAAAAVAAASQNKSSPYVMRLRNQRSWLLTHALLTLTDYLS